jgi:TPP-dependent 2-oxoacid decarboxylase
MHRPLPLKILFYWKLFSAYTTMLKNIVASKAAVGPLNTSKDKIITVLTPCLKPKIPLYLIVSYY